MGQSSFWKGVTNILFPPSISMGKDQQINDAFAAQQQAGENASEQMAKQYAEQKQLYEPLIKIGDRQLELLNSQVLGRAFLPDEGVFKDYQPREYNQDFYDPQKQFTYSQQAPALNAPRPIQYDANDRFAPQLAPQRMFNYNAEKQPGYNFSQYQYQGPQSPQQIQYSQNQFSPYQQTEQQPDQYRAPSAPGREYWQPEQFNIANDPVYQNAISEANKATEASAAARGMQLSGANLKDLNSNAVSLANQYGQEAFNRYATRQGMNQSALNYQGEDIYNRYGNEVGQRNLENQQELGQFNTNRNFGQAAATENLGNALAVQGQNYGQYSGDRGMGLSEYQTNLGGKQFEYGANIGQYNTNRDFAFGANQALSADDLARYAAQTGQYNQNLQNQLQTQNQAWNQAYDPYLTNLGQYNTNRAFDYNVYQDYGSNQLGALQYNNALVQTQDANRYQMLTDQYNRAAQRGSSQYGMIGELANLAATGRQGVGASANDYYGSQADIGIGTANAYAAAQAALANRGGILNTLLGN